MIRLIHIAPELPPTVGGVADYTSILTRRLVEVSEGAIKPVLVHAGQQQVDTINVDVPVVDLSGEMSAMALAEAVRSWAGDENDQAVVLLEYSGYGYAARGAPLWLVRGLSRVCGNDGRPLITIFHELYANSYKPWNARFWVMPFQRYLTTRLATMSDGILANWDEAANWLSGRVNGTPLRMSPTFSNVGEPEALPDYSERKPYAVCFGRAGRKEEMYQQHVKTLNSTLQSAGIERIVDIGSPPSEASYIGLNVPVNTTGIQPVDAISTCLREASLGLLNYPLHCLKKSGIWAAYAAHGVPAVLPAEPQTIPNLKEGEHFLRLGSARPTQNQLASISEAVYKWYDHEARSEDAAHRVANLICELS